LELHGLRIKVGSLSKLCKLHVMMASLTACGIAHPWSRVFAQTYEQFLKPYEIPSPSGISVLSKQYIPNGPWIYRLLTKIDAQTTNSVRTDLLSGHYPGGIRGSDGLVAGWQGDKHLTIGWPVGEPLISGPSRVGFVEIAYISYALELLTTMDGVAQVTLRDVEYKVQEIEDGFHNTECVIHITATDGVYFDNVLMDVVGNGVGTKRVEGLGSAGSISIKFSLTSLVGRRSPSLTPTQAKLSDITPFSSQSFFSHGPIQDGMSLDYSMFLSGDASKIFNVLRTGQYNIFFNLTFGELKIAYLVHDPIDAVAAAAYQKCEARTNIFKRLFGKELSPP